MTTLEFKPDLDQALKRFEAWWHLENQDRPLVSFGVAQGKIANPLPTAKQYITVDGRKMVDPEWHTAFHGEQNLSNRPWIAESLPVYMPDLGPDLTSTLYGVDLEFMEYSSYAKPIIKDISEWNDFLSRETNFNNPYWKTIEKMAQLSFARGKGRYLIGVPDLHNSYDILVGMRSPELLCMDVLDEPELIDRVAKKVAEGFRESFRRSYQWLADAGQPATTWTPFLHQGTAYVTSCDFWCLVSAEIAREMILPRLLEEMEGMERTIFHLDGPRALRHLDILLEIPNLTAVQWLYGAGQGNASRWLDVYKKILAAGKAVQVCCSDPEDALCATRALGSKGVWLTLDHCFKDADEANRFVTRIAEAASTR